MLLLGWGAGIRDILDTAHLHHRRVSLGFHLPVDGNFVPHVFREALWLKGDRFERSQLLLNGLEPLMRVNRTVEWLPAGAILVVLLGSLILLVVAPRLLRTPAQ